MRHLWFKRSYRDLFLPWIVVDWVRKSIELYIYNLCTFLFVHYTLIKYLKLKTFLLFLSCFLLTPKLGSCGPWHDAAVRRCASLRKLLLSLSLLLPLSPFAWLVFHRLEAESTEVRGHGPMACLLGPRQFYSQPSETTESSSAIGRKLWDF